MRLVYGLWVPMGSCLEAKARQCVYNRLCYDFGSTTSSHCIASDNFVVLYNFLICWFKYIYVSLYVYIILPVIIQIGDTDMWVEFFTCKCKHIIIYFLSLISCWYSVGLAYIVHLDYTHPLLLLSFDPDSSQGDLHNG